MMRSSRLTWLRTLVPCAVSVMFTLILCAQAREGATEPDKTPAQAEAGRKDGEMLEAERKGILETVASAAGKIEAIRGLSFKEPVKKAVLTPDEFIAYTRETIEKNNEPETFERMGRTLKVMGMIPQNMNFKDYMLSQIAANVVGAYDPIDKTLRLILGRIPGQQEETISHELHHALQDQNYPAMMKSAHESSGDRGEAIRALLEADAYLMQEAYALDKNGVKLDQYRILLGEKLISGRKGEQAQARRRGIPVYFIDKATFENAEAVNFAHALYRSGGWKALNEALGNPPDSTEQLLHPERFIARRDYPTTVKLDELEKMLKEKYGRKSIEDGSMGEFMVRAWLRTHLGEGSDAAAAGWDGDGYCIWYDEKSNHTSLAWVTVWDSPADADEFVGAAKTALEKQRGMKLLAGPENEKEFVSYAAATKDHGMVRIARSGKLVTILDGITDADKEAPGLADKAVTEFDKQDTNKGADDAKPLEPVIRPATDAAVKPPTWDGEAQRYENYRFQWAVTLAKKDQWVRTVIPFADENALLWLDLARKMVPVITVNARAALVDMDLSREQRAKLFEGGHASGVRQYKRLSLEDCEISGMKGFVLSYEGVYTHPITGGEMLRVHHAYVVWDDERIFTFIGNAEPEVLPEHEAVMKEFVESVEILHPRKDWPKPTTAAGASGGDTYRNEEFNFQMSELPGWRLFPAEKWRQGEPWTDIPGKRAIAVMIYQRFPPIVKVLAEKKPLGFDLDAEVNATIEAAKADEKNIVSEKVKADFAGVPAYEWGCETGAGGRYSKNICFVKGHIYYRIELDSANKVLSTVTEQMVAPSRGTFKLLR